MPELIGAVSHFRAEIDEEVWGLVGAAAVVCRNQGQVWPGRVLSYHSTSRLRAEWRLKSRAEVQELVTYSDTLALGDPLIVHGPGAVKWDATFVERSPATRVLIEYRIKSGAWKKGTFFAEGLVGAILVPLPDGGAELRTLSWS